MDVTTGLAAAATVVGLVGIIVHLGRSVGRLEERLANLSTREAELRAGLDRHTTQATDAGGRLIRTEERLASLGEQVVTQLRDGQTGA